MSEDRDLWAANPEFDEPDSDGEEELLADLEDEWEDEHAHWEEDE